jgi:hypothetical protein
MGEFVLKLKKAILDELTDMVNCMDSAWTVGLR